MQINFIKILGDKQTKLKTQFLYTNFLYLNNSLLV